MMCQFLLYSRMNQLYIHIYPLFFRFFSHIGHYRVLSRVPCAIEQLLISYLLYIQQCVYDNPNLPIYPSPPLSPLVTIISSCPALVLFQCHKEGKEKSDNSSSKQSVLLSFTYVCTYYVYTCVYSYISQVIFNNKQCQNQLINLLDYWGNLTSVHQHTALLRQEFLFQDLIFPHWPCKCFCLKDSERYLKFLFII